MRIVLVLVVALIVVSFVSSAQTPKCGTYQHEQLLLSQNPKLDSIRIQAETILQQQIQKQSELKLETALPAIITIPVVVHVVYHTQLENISDEQVQSQIAALNRDYMKMNADTVDIPSVWQPLAAKIGIEFCLATKDPNGLDTNGITRTYTNDTVFSLDDSMKYQAPVWNPQAYLNIWVCNLGNQIYGYTQMPTELTTNPATDGVVCNYFAFGTTGSAVAPSNLGRTCTHEVGHWFNLIHTWGDAVCGNDNVADTPEQKQAHYGCNWTFPEMTYNCVTPETNGTMFMDYMDYSDDPCMYMFTTDQKTRMLSSITTYRSKILTSNVCTASMTGINEIVNNSNKVNCFPNPASTVITITSEVPMQKIFICDAVGKLVYVNASLSNSNSQGNVTQVDIRNWSNGIYFMKVVGDEQVTSKKIIVTH